MFRNRNGEGVNILLSQLGTKWTVYMEVFDKNILVKIFEGELKLWIIFLSHHKSGTIVMIYDPEISRQEIAKIKATVDKFYDDRKSYLYNSANRYSACIWDEKDCDIETLRKVIAEAAKNSPFAWLELLEKLNNKED